ncbi:MAG: DUF2461 domain-containing protein [Candidatus Kapaibacterium sp.]
MALKEFTGYSAVGLQFLVDLKENNNKEWFDANRSIYEKELREVSKALISELGRRFTSAGLPYIADIKRSMFRINRDIRFSNNKDPYKTNIGMFFPFDINGLFDKKTKSLGLYFHLEPGSHLAGAGIVMPDNDTLLNIRQGIAANSEEFLSVVEGGLFKKEFPEEHIASTPLKNVPRGFEKGSPAEYYLKKKDHSYFSFIDENEVLKPELPEYIEYKAAAALPFLGLLDSFING